MCHAHRAGDSLPGLNPAALVLPGLGPRARWETPNLTWALIVAGGEVWITPKDAEVSPHHLRTVTRSQIGRAGSRDGPTCTGRTWKGPEVLRKWVAEKNLELRGQAW